jgi:hypothetical protein
MGSDRPWGLLGKELEQQRKKRGTLARKGPGRKEVAPYGGGDSSKGRRDEMAAPQGLERQRRRGRSARVCCWAQTSTYSLPTL